MRFSKLGFSFYGSGNVGDDLMLAGFLREWQNRRPLFCVVPIEQKRVLVARFPEVLWCAPQERQPEYDLWLGVGDTPIQIKSGLFMLELLEKEYAICAQKKIPMAFIGIGVEQEAVYQVKRFRRILENAISISTRDLDSFKILTTNFGLPAERIFVGDDLAHIPLAALFDTRTELDLRPLDLAVNFYAEHSNWWNHFVINQWLYMQSKKRTVAILANETRMFPKSECRRYAEQAWYFVLGRKSCGIPLLSPNPWALRLNDLVSHFTSINVVISSRYHCLMAAAWAGCRVSVIARSSKISFIQSQLKLPCAVPPLNYQKLDEVEGLACVVPFQTLKTIAENASKVTKAIIKKLD
jgi:polysaccharide pyruvyl transferase WcaK-like protein